MEVWGYLKLIVKGKRYFERNYCGVVGRVNLLIVKKPLLSLFVLAVSDSDLNYRRFRYTSEQVGMGEEERE